MATIEEFEKIDVRVGRVLSVEPLEGARRPSFKMRIDFGLLGVKVSCGQFTQVHAAGELVGKLVLCVVNFPPRMIANVASEVLTMGVPDENGNWVIISPLKEVPLGGRMA